MKIILDVVVLTTWTKQRAGMINSDFEEGGREKER